MPDTSLTAGPDALIELIKKKGSMRVRQAAAEINVSPGIIEEWCNMLKKYKVVDLVIPMTGDSIILRGEQIGGTTEEKQALIKEVEKDNKKVEKQAPQSGKAKAPPVSEGPDKYTLLEIVDRSALIKFGEAAKRVGVDRKQIEKWANELRREKLVNIKMHFLGDSDLVAVKHEKIVRAGQQQDAKVNEEKVIESVDIDGEMVDIESVPVIKIYEN